MIRVLVELWPGGSEVARQPIAHIAIANLTPHLDPARYGAVCLDAQLTEAASCSVEDHAASAGWAALLARALEPPEDSSPVEPELADAIADRLRDGLRALSGEAEAEANARTAQSAAVRTQRPEEADAQTEGGSSSRSPREIILLARALVATREALAEPVSDRLRDLASQPLPPPRRGSQ